MTSLARRAATCVVLAVTGFSASSQAQSTTTVLPRRTTDLRLATQPVAAPIVQQSPNGLYKLSITDTGIELLGPKGLVRITDAGIEIGGPTTTSVGIRATDMNVRIDQAVRLEAGSNMDIRASSNMDLRASSAVQITGAAGASLLGSVVNLGCSSGKPAARATDQVNTTVSPALILQGSQTVRVC
jgi:hypothetical protein